MCLLLFQKGPRPTTPCGCPAGQVWGVGTSPRLLSLSTPRDLKCLFWVALSRRYLLLGGGGWLERFALLFMLPWPEALPQVTVLIPFLSGPNYLGLFSHKSYLHLSYRSPCPFTVPLSCL